MTDIITYCDINICEECPRYGDDCDGDKYLDRYPTMHEYAEGKRINPKLTDLISRADAIEAVCEECSERWKHYKGCDLYKDGQCFEITALMALPSADAVQGWIPCSERLPKEKARVLTYDSMGDIVFGQYDKGRWYWEAEACADYWAKNDGVIAWQPLPTPYKGGDTE